MDRYFLLTSNAFNADPIMIGVPSPSKPYSVSNSRTSISTCQKEKNPHEHWIKTVSKTFAEDETKHHSPIGEKLPNRGKGAQSRRK
jgi:hypothetical protein